MKNVTAAAEYLEESESTEVSQDWPLTDARGNACEVVLVVDDEPLIREILVDALRRSGYRVLEAASAAAAQRLAATEEKIDLLLTDFSMPEVDGLELAFWFRAHYPETRVMIASGSLWELNQQRCKSEQIACLSKPFTQLELAQAVRAALR
jgi:CheY-like chemotaxis protein